MLEDKFMSNISPDGSSFNLQQADTLKLVEANLNATSDKVKIAQLEEKLKAATNSLDMRTVLTEKFDVKRLEDKKTLALLQTNLRNVERKH